MADGSGKKCGHKLERMDSIIITMSRILPKLLCKVSLELLALLVSQINLLSLKLTVCPVQHLPAEQQGGRGSVVVFCLMTVHLRTVPSMSTCGSVFGQETEPYIATNTKLHMKYRVHMIRSAV